MPKNANLGSLLTELQGAQAREAASREILDLISQSHEDQSPVFRAILQNASRLCHAPMALLGLLNKDKTHIDIAEHVGARTDYFDFLQNNPPDFAPDQFLAARAIQNLETFQEADVSLSSVIGSEMQHRDQAVRKEGMRTVLFAPMHVKGEALGCIILYRREVQPFTDEEIDLVEAFASQAVVAVQNARHFDEVQTANTRLKSQLDREKASAEVLSIIGKSRDDYSPVFNAILENAAQLCDAPVAGLHLVNDQRTHHRLTHVWGADPGLTEVGEAWDLTRPLQVSTCIREARLIHTTDLKDDPLYDAGDPVRRHLVDVEGVRTLLSVPLMKDGVAFGCFNLNRTEVRPFSDADIQLLEIFADQAVIAIENVRQFRELQERLKREAASSEILQIISQARDDTAPVFNAIVERAATLCSAQAARVLLVDEAAKRLRYVASWGTDLTSLGLADEFDYDEGQISRAIRERRVIACDDLSQDAEYLRGDPVHKVLVEQGNVRSRVVVPLGKGNRALGAIALSRHEVRPFSGDEISLVVSFAAQAVIAIENTQQFKALEKRTSEIQMLNASLEAKVEEQVGEIERMGKLKRFLPSAVANTIVSSGSEDVLKSHRALLGVLFCDIRGFTAFCETAEPEETIEVLQTYHEEMGKLIDAHGAGVDHRMGDGIMVLFNDPLPCEDPAGDAVKLAIAMRARMSDLCRSWKRMGYRLGFGVGISLGYATVGMVGFEGRSDYTASGTAINLASRLCDEAEDGEILLSTRAAIAIEDVFASVSVGKVSLKGIREPVEVFRLNSAEERN